MRMQCHRKAKCNGYGRASGAAEQLGLAGCGQRREKKTLGKGSWQQVHSGNSLRVRAEHRAAKPSERKRKCVSGIGIERGEGGLVLTVLQLDSCSCNRIG